MKIFNIRLGSTIIIKISLAIISSALALFIPLQLLTTEQAILAVKHYSFWIIGATSLLFLFHLKDSLTQHSCKKLTAKPQAHLPALIVILLATCYLHLNTDRSFKILYDEHAISSTAMSMHENARTYVQSVTHNLPDGTHIGLGFVDKRPAFFPFTLSAVHRLTGYRPENAFWLNSGLTFLLLGFIYLIVERTTGKAYGILSVLLLTSLPLLAQNTTGGGYEIMNLCLICGLILAGVHYMQLPGKHGLDLLLLTSILLANNRYESIMYATVPALLFLLKSYREKELSLTWFSAVSPLLLITPLLSYAVFQGNEQFVQTPRENFFSLEHLPTNIKHAFLYLFETSGSYTNSVLLSSTGIIACIALAIYLIHNARLSLKENNEITVCFAIFIIISLNTTLALACYWGEWTDPMTSRFSLPLQLSFVIATPLALHHYIKYKHTALWFLAISVAYIIFVSSPHSQWHNINSKLYVSKASNCAIDWMLEHTGSTTNQMVVSDTAIGFGLYGYASSTFDTATPTLISRIQKLGFYENIYFVETLFYEMDDEKRIRLNPSKLNSGFILEPLEQFRFSPKAVLQISRLEGIAGAPHHTTKMIPSTNDDAYSAYIEETFSLIIKVEKVAD